MGNKYVRQGLATLGATAMLGAAALLASSCSQTPRIPPPQPRLNPIELARGSMSLRSAQVTIAQMGGADHAAVVWEQDGHIHSRTFLHRPNTPVDCCWAADADLGSGVEPDVAMDGNGMSLAVWRNQSEIVGRAFIPGQGWRNPETVSAGTAFRVTAPGVAMAQSGSAFVVWARGGWVMARPFVSSSGWGAEARINPNGTAAENEAPRVAMDPSANAVAIWRNLAGNQQAMNANRFTAGQGWSNPTAIEPPGRASVRGQVAMDANGTAVAVWEKLTTLVTTFANRGVANGSWESPTQIPFGSDTARAARMPRIAMDAAGNAFAVWAQESQVSGRNRIRSRWYAPGQGWGAPIDLSNVANSHSPHLAANAGGNVAATWVESDGSEERLLVSFFRPPAGWQQQPRIVKTVNIRDRSIVEPRVAIYPPGYALLIWTEAEPAGGSAGARTLNAVFIQ